MNDQTKQVQLSIPEKFCINLKAALANGQNNFADFSIELLKNTCLHAIQKRKALKARIAEYIIAKIKELAIEYPRSFLDWHYTVPTDRAALT